MATRSYTTLDQAKYPSNKLQRKLTKFCPSDVQHVYMSAQPVLSCRTVDIDLPGTRTYRQKSTLDILEEHQKLIRKLCQKQRISASAPSRGRTFQSPRTSSEYTSRTVTLPSPRTSSEHGFKKVNIEIKGRPLTSGQYLSFCPREDKESVTSRRRPKTTDCYTVVRDDKDLAYLSQSNQELNQKLHSYWTSENNSLATGKFIRGQKRPDDVLPTLDSWLTFGGASRAQSKGIIDAFASFKNSEEYYKIEGSVGSQVARQLQKGDKIRIGINGILHARNLKVKTMNKKNLSDTRALFVKGETKQDLTQEMMKELQLQGTKLTGETLQWTEPNKEERIQETELKRIDENLTNVQSTSSPSDDEFKDLVISALDDFNENVTEEEKQKPISPKNSEIPADPVAVEPIPKEETFEAVTSLSTPLSWSDQCSKSNVRIIHANISQKEILKPVASETFPIKFEKLVNGEPRPQLAEVRHDSYKIKQRSVHVRNGSKDKVKVVYIDPLTKEEEEEVNGLSVEKIINHRLEGRNRESPATSGITEHYEKSMNENIKEDNPAHPQRVGSTRSEPRSNRRTSYNNSHGDRNNVHSPKLKVTPVHSATIRHVGNLRIMSTDAKNTPTREDIAKTAKLPGKHTSTKSYRRAGVGRGSSIKDSLPQSETEYIKITSQLKITPGSASSVNLPHQSTISSPYQSTTATTTTQDLDYQVMDKIQLRSETPESSTTEADVSQSNDILPHRKHITTPTNDSNIDENYKDENDSKEPESQISTTTPINIPTADEESFCHLLPSDMTSDSLNAKQPGIQDNEEENIDEIVPQLEEHFTDS